MIDLRSIPPEELNRLLMLLRGDQMPSPQPAPDENNMLAQMLRQNPQQMAMMDMFKPKQRPQTGTDTIGIRG